LFFYFYLVFLAFEILVQRFFPLLEINLTEEQNKQLADIFADGTEQDFYVRVNFVGFTGAGKTSAMYQIFRKVFNPKEIESTNLMDISLGYCTIDLVTGQWKRHHGSGKYIYIYTIPRI